jgi:hypothetical protein
VRDRALWLEATANVRQRLLDLLTVPQTGYLLSRVLEQSNLWFRAASTGGMDEARRTANQLLRRAHGVGLPQNA